MLLTAATAFNPARTMANLAAGGYGGIATIGRSPHAEPESPGGW